MIYDHNINMGMVSKKHTQPNPTKVHPSHDESIEHGSRTKRLRVGQGVLLLIGETWDDYQVATMPRRIPVEGKYNIESIYHFDLDTAAIKVQIMKSGDTKDINISYNISVRKTTKGHVLLL